SRRDLEILISDERDRLLDSAGGIIKALPQLGPEPFFLLNADTFWIDGPRANLDGLALAWQARSMDILLMLVESQKAYGHTGGGDFMPGDRCLLRRARGRADALIYAGAAIIHPRIFAGAVPEPQSLNLYFDRAIADSRL